MLNFDTIRVQWNWNSFLFILDLKEYVNEKKLQQDHPCLIQLIRDKYLLQPASKELPYVLDHPETIDPSNGQANDIREILKNKVSRIMGLIVYKYLQQK